MSEHGEEIYADLLQIYGVEVDKISPRRALALVRQLPPSSRLIAKLEGQEFFQWDRQVTVLADIYDMLATLVTMTARANSKKPKQIPEPERYPRPGQKNKKRKKSNHLLEALKGESVMNLFDDSNIVPLL